MPPPAAADLSLPLLVWSSSSGLVRPSGGGLPETQDPDRALAAVAALEGEVLALFHDLHPYLERPEVARRLRELDRRFGGGRSTAVLAGVGVELPGSLAHRVYHAFSERRPLTTEVLVAEAEATRPLSRLRPEAVAALRAWEKAHARSA